MTAAEYPPESHVDYDGHIWDRLPDGNWRDRLTGAILPTPKFTAPDWSFT